MPTLLDVERAFRATFLEPENGDAAEHVIADGISPDDRLDIYRNTFIAALTKALRLNFPAVLRLVGDEFFDAAARIFIEAHPPKSAWLDAYGGEFPAFLAAFPASVVADLSGRRRAPRMGRGKRLSCSREDGPRSWADVEHSAGRPWPTALRPRSVPEPCAGRSSGGRDLAGGSGRGRCGDGRDRFERRIAVASGAPARRGCRCDPSRRGRRVIPQRALRGRAA